ncbi:type VI secretion system protein TssA [Herbaspirillum robiniae]|uniref:type VI secretion system protein TssA n=1 Tax=Herbaspirillum robiniae TaxID=2014887 RepID=UPI001EDC5E8E|nr:type VI secretion system protein TssA [Herbaspirillum robiniae]
MDLTQLSSLGKQPISDAQPAGRDVREEGEFDLLQNEIAKMSNPAASSSVDWTQVVAQAATLTGAKGKDIMVACYLAGGLLQTEGLPGLAAGLQVLDEMLQAYWDTLYPPLARLRARRNALQWLMDRIRAHGDEHDWSSFPPQDEELVTALRERLKSIDAFVADKDTEAPSLRPAISQVGNLLVKESAPPPAAEPVTAAPVAAPPASASAASSSPMASSAPAQAAPAMAALAGGPVDSPAAAEAAGAEALQRLADIAQWLGEGELNQPPAFRLNRIAAWGGIEQLPPATGGKTNLPGPVPQVLDALKTMQNRQAFEDLVRFAEAQLAVFPFWLDMNCVAAQALERMGGAYDAARREVCGASAWLVTRLPGIEDLAFSNGTPFASADTRQWLQSLGTGGAGAGTDGAPRMDAVQTAGGNARALAADGNLAGAAELLQKAIGQSAAPAARLQLRVALCELLLAERPGASLDAFARALVTEVDRYCLTEWDPPLAASALQAAWNVLSRNDELKTETDALLARLVAIDAGAAVRLVT